MNPDNELFNTHINNGDFLDGVSRKKWRFIDLDWPFVWIAIRALKKEGCPDEYIFRFQCGQYPQIAPTAVPWDLKLKTPLEHNQWPAGTGPVSTVFRPEWKPDALYTAMDRIGLEAHPEWATNFPQTSWNPRREITHYLGLIYDHLNSAHYQGTRRSVGGHCQCPVCLAQNSR